MPRIRALIAHLLFSILILVALLILMLYLWYPQPYFAIDGGWHRLKLSLLITLVIGPLLTFVLFNPQKSRTELTLDLSLVICLQVGWLIYSTLQFFSQHPVAQVLTYEGKVRAIPREVLTKQKDFFSMDKIKKLNISQAHPAFVYAKPAETKEEQLGVTAYGFSEGLGPESLAFLYEPVNKKEAFADILALAPKSREKLINDADNKTAIEAYEKTHPGTFYYFPLKARYGEAVIVLNDKAYPVDYLNIKKYPN